LISAATVSHLPSFPTRRSSDLVTNLPPDHMFPARVAQILQHRIDPAQPGLFEFWDFSDRTPLAGMVAASVSGGLGIELPATAWRSEEHTSELQSRFDLVCRLLL